MKLLLIFNLVLSFMGSIAQECYEMPKEATKLSANNYTDIVDSKYSTYNDFVIKVRSSKNADDLYEFATNTRVEGFIFQEIMARKAKPSYFSKLPSDFIKFVDALKTDTAARIEILSKVSYTLDSKIVIIVKYLYTSISATNYGVLNFQRENNTYAILLNPPHPKLSYIVKVLRKDKLGSALRPNTGDKQLDALLGITKANTYRTNIDLYYDALVKIKIENESLYKLICDN